jgi:putative ABC transport system permease protein
VLGTRASAGRLLDDRDDVTVGGHAVTVISHELWERRFAADPNIVGQTIALNRHPFTVVGIAPRGFQGTTLIKPDVWVSLSMLVEATPRETADMLTSRTSSWLIMGGRLKEDVAIQQARSEITAIAAALQREYPDDYRDRGLAVAGTAIVPGRINVVTAFMGLLMVIVGLVLLIACVNVAGMMLACAAARRREVAVRLAIGAGRGRLMRQLMTEAVLVFLAGGIIGVLLSPLLTSLLMGFLPHLPFPVVLSVATDWRVLTFAGCLMLVTAVLSGLAPALQASGGDLFPALKMEGLDSGPRRLRLRSAFVIGQVTMSLLLVVAAGLFLRALQHAASIQPGFDQERVDVATLDLSLGGYRDETGRVFLKDVLQRISAMPGVNSATATADLPLDGGRMGLGGLRVPGMVGPDGRDELNADWNAVEPGFFRTLRIRLVSGRDFTERDATGAPLVAIVNEALARRAWPNRDAIGQQLLADVGESEAQTLTVVGVASDAKLVSLGGAAEPYIYVPIGQRYISRLSLLVRRTSDASSVPQIRSLLREMNPNLPLTEALALREVTAIGLVPQRIAASEAGSLGLVGLILAALGIYGVTAYAVSGRTREIGIRIALGADQGRVLRFVLRQGLLLASIGVAIGVVLAGAGSTLIESLLFGVRPLDPATFLGTCLLFALVTLVASYVPARRATKVDPMVALRSE